MASLVSGAAFGAAMAAAGFHNPSIIRDQFRFSNWHMLQAFMTATATSAFIYAVAEKLGCVRLPPRASSPLGIACAYDGNIIGGALLGAGMALSGSCPGTLFAQVGAGIGTGFSALQGAAAGGIIWAGFLEDAIARRRQRTGATATAHAIHQHLGLSRTSMLLVIEAACLAVVVATLLLAPSSSSVPFTGPLGGLFIGLAQLVSLTTRGSLVGVSRAYQEMGDCFCRFARSTRSDTIKPGSYRGLLFAAGIAVGAWTLLRLLPAYPPTSLAHVSPAMATAGGVLMAIGSRMAGGCTSGHGISGISLLSVSSIVSILSIFVSAAAVVFLTG